jgi:hypothetical protein
MNQSKILNMGFMAFIFAFIGALFGFCGFYIEVRTLSVVGFVITLISVLVGFICIIYFWVIGGKNAISNSTSEAASLRVKIRKL